LIQSPTAARRLLLGELSEKAESQLRDLELELYGGKECDSPFTLRAILACRMGARLEDVAHLLDWKEFESFSAGLLRAKGFDVEENVFVKRPRAQVDVLARSGLVSLAVDCKHWERGMGPSSLKRCVEAQRRRAKLLRAARSTLAPLESVILLLAEEEVRFVAGGAVVPVRTLGSFLEGIQGFDELEFD